MSQMSKRDAVVIVSRAFALYFLCWAISDVTYLPSSISWLSFHASRGSVLAPDASLRNHDVISLSFLVLRIVLLFTAAAWMYRCGPRVEAFFCRR
jgi:hypothetical protein